jgi:hypothetical protein
MSATEQPNRTAGGFSGKRVGYVLAIVSLALVPGHFYVSCDSSGAIALASTIVLLATIVLSCIVPRGTPNRFGPVALAFIAVMAHALCAH